MGTDLRPLNVEHFSDCLLPRDLSSHKGTHGSAGLIGGSAGMGGALLLAARSALWLGSGRVFAAFLAEPSDTFALRVDPICPELMLRSPSDLLAPDIFSQLTAIAIGPGLGRSDAAVTFLMRVLKTALPVVVDADGLNLLAFNAELRSLLGNRIAPTVLTPHPAEAARLLGVSAATVQEQREASCVELVRQMNAHIVLKGGGSLIGSPEDVLPETQILYQNQTGNPGMASAGMGDVLTGMVTALLAQGRAPAQALRAAVYVHGQAADSLVARGIGPIGLTASEVGLEARQVVNRMVADASRVAPSNSALA